MPTCIHHRGTENTEELKFFICREMPPNENYASACLTYFLESILYCRKKGMYDEMGPSPPEADEQVAHSRHLPRMSKALSSVLSVSLR